jgi:hypothetical protein
MVKPYSMANDLRWGAISGVNFGVFHVRIISRFGIRRINE